MMSWCFGVALFGVALPASTAAASPVFGVDCDGPVGAFFVGGVFGGFEDPRICRPACASPCTYPQAGVISRKPARRAPECAMRRTQCANACAPSTSNEATTGYRQDGSKAAARNSAPPGPCHPIIGDHPPSLVVMAL